MTQPSSTHPSSSDSEFTSPATTLADRLAALRQRLDEAARQESGAPSSAATRDSLKADIIALFRDADLAVQSAQQLKHEVKDLVGVWKQLPTDGEPAMRRSLTPTRVDHLGASTFVEKGWSRLSLGDAAGAEVSLRKALDLAPGHQEAETLLGWALTMQDRHDEALGSLDAVLARDAQYALARATVGLVYLRRGQLADAIAHLEAVLPMGSDRKATLYAHLYLGMALRDSQRFADAESALLQALALGPNLLQAWYELGWSRWRAEQHSEALTAWRTGAEANKFSPWGKRCAEMIAQVEQGSVPSWSD